VFFHCLHWGDEVWRQTKTRHVLVNMFLQTLKLLGSIIIVL
jgi:hypothetical protein